MPCLRDFSEAGGILPPQLIQSIKSLTKGLFSSQADYYSDKTESPT